MSSFEDTKAYVAIYFYSYFLISFVIIVGAYHVTKKVQLLYESYQALDAIEHRLAIIAIAIKGYENKYNFVSIKDHKRQKYQFLNIATAAHLINTEFDAIHEIIDIHKTQLISKLDTIKQQGIEVQKHNQWQLTLKNKKNNHKHKHSTRVTSITAYKNQNENNLGSYISSSPGPMIEIEDAGAAHEVESNDETLNSDQLQILINKSLDKHDISKCKGLKTWLKTIWEIKSLMIPCIAHYFDTASDLALVIEWYFLYQQQKGNYGDNYNYNDQHLDNIDMKTMFYCSASVLIYYRLSSVYEIYNFSQSIKDAILQFIFDLYLIKAIYVNIHKMKTFKALPFVRIIRGLEGSTESAFQAILALVFLLKIRQTDFIAIVSLITSLYSLVSRNIFEDSYRLPKDAQESGIEFNDIFEVLSCHKCDIFKDIHPRWINFMFFRGLDVVINIVMIGLYWSLMGDLWFALTFGIIGICHIVWLMTVSGKIPVKFFTTLFLKTPLGMHSTLWENPLYCIRIKCKIPCRYGRAVLFSMLRFGITFVCLGRYYLSMNLDMYKNDFVFWLIVVTFVIANLVLPMWFWLLIVRKELLLGRDTRTKYSGGMDIGHAVFYGDFEYVLFAKSMGANIFKQKSWFVKKLQSIVPILWLRSGKRVIAARGLNIMEAFAMQYQFNHQLFEFLKQWYNEIYDTDDENMYGFEKYLASLVDNEIAWIIARRSLNCQIFDALSNGGLKFNEYNDVNMYDKGWNMLHEACFAGKSVNVVEWFLKNNIYDINSTTQDGRTALHVLLSQMNVIAIGNNTMKKDKIRKKFQLLLQYGIDIFAKDNHHKTAFEQSNVSQEFILWLCQPINKVWV